MDGRRSARALLGCLFFSFFFTSSLGLEPARARWAQRMGRDPPPVLPGRLAAEEAPAEEAAEVWVRWAVLRLTLLLMVLLLLRQHLSLIHI